MPVVLRLRLRGSIQSALCTIFAKPAGRPLVISYVDIPPKYLDQTAVGYGIIFVPPISIANLSTPGTAGRSSTSGGLQWFSKLFWFHHVE